MTPTGRPSRYRAVLPAIGDKQAQQAFGNCLNKMREWAQKTADDTQVAVPIYEMADVLVDTVSPRPKEQKSDVR